MPRMRFSSRALLIAGEVAAALAVASLLVAALESVAPVAALGVIYILAVLLIAIRRGEVLALATAILSVLVLNFFFIPPRHRLTIADDHNVAALAVFLITALVVGRLAASARQQAHQADARAAEAGAREQESTLLAAVASSLLTGRSLPAHVDGADARLGLSPVPSKRAGEIAVSLPMREQSGWLYVSEAAWTRANAERIVGPLADLIDAQLQRRRLSERAAEAETALRGDMAKTAVLHAISHDLRSPLTAITTATSALGGGPLSKADQRELLAVLQTESARLDRVVGDLLALSRIEAGAVNPRPDWCDLRDTVASAAEHVRATQGEHPIEITLPGDMPLVRADPVQMERVFANLIENAVKFSPPESPVRIDGSASGRVAVRVTDRGRGIPAGQRPRVFEPFFRGRDGAAGSGLGLAICRGFVEANGARIQLQTGRGQGTTFAVSFPATEQPTLR